MKNARVLTRRRQQLLVSSTVLGLFAAALFAIFWLIDVKVVSPPARGADAPGPLDLLFALDAETLENALGSLAQVIVAVLAIAITVVSIVVQLAATRYTSRIANMFFRDRTNVAVMGFFVVVCIDAVWVSLAVSRSYVPRATVLMTVVMVTGSLLLLVPYFAHVFDFLDPEKVILRIADQALDAAVSDRSPAGADVTARQAVATMNLEHLADVAVNAVAQKDKVIASNVMVAMRNVLVQYQSKKRQLPDGWFELGPRLREDPDFIALAPDSVHALESQKAWLEWKGLRHFRTVFAESIAHLSEMSHVVAIESRYVGESALEASDRPVIHIVVKFFNTYVRTSINARDVRASYNVLHQYRQLAERLMDAHFYDEVADVGHHFLYYGQTARAQGLSFVTETAAYDLSALCEYAFEHQHQCHDALLKTFLEIDKEAETSAEEKALRGVRKAQVKLAAYYLLRGAEAPARAIFLDLRHEPAERLDSIRGELLGIKARDFWEVTERGVNFDYLDDARKAKVDEFFGWLARD